MIEGILLLVKYRHALIPIARNEIRQKYTGSIFGLAWLVLYPLIFLAIYSGVYLFIFKIKIPEFSNWGYVLMVFCGLVPYIGFSETIQQGSQSLATSQNLLKNTIFPTPLIPVKAVLCAQTVHAAALFVLTLFSIASGNMTPKLLLVPAVFILQAMMLQGLVWCLSILRMAIRDMQHVLNLLLLFLLFLSPIAFTAESVPPVFRVFLYLNPLYYVISLYRGCLIANAPLFFIHFVVIAGLSVWFFAAGFTFFKRFEEKLWEYV